MSPRTARQLLSRLVGVFLFACSVSLLVAGCSDSDPQAAPDPIASSTLSIGYPHVTGQDPLHGMQQAARLISFEGLVLPNRNGRVQARIAESWSESPDGLSWRFKLRADAYFHDGSKVSAAAVKESLVRSLANADLQSYPGLGDISSVEAPAESELVFQLRNRSSFLLDDLGVAIQKLIPGQPSVGVGPYKTISANAEELVMESVPNHYRGRPQLDRIVWKSYPSVRAAWAAMMRGDIDFLYEVGPEAVEFMRGEASVNVFSFLRSYLLGVILNSKRPAFADWRVRRALNYAIDRETVVSSALRGHGMPATGPAWPQHWAYDSMLPELTHDPLRATALFDSANLVLKPHENRLPSRLSFAAILPENFALWERMGLLAQRDLAKVGVDMQLQTLSVTEFNRRIAAGDFDAILTEFVVGNSPSRPLTFWHSQSKRNMFGYTNPSMDQAFESMRRAANENEYRDGFRRFQVEGVENPPAIYLVLGEISRAVSKRIQVVAQPGNDILHTIADWRPAETSN